MAISITAWSADKAYTQGDFTKGSKIAKASPAEAIKFLKEGNLRFVSGKSIRPNLNAARLAQAGRENQGNHAYATVITCSDSRVPVEHIFDAGVMDTFIIRVAGNVCDTDEVGSIEYGLSHVKTPVLVVLGHTQCGAVTAVTHAVNGTGHALEYNIPPLVDNIQPAVKRAQALNPSLHGDAVIPHAIEENVWQGIEDLFLKSASTRKLVASGKAMVVGAIYDVGTGKIKWLDESKTMKILAKVESNPDRIASAMAGGGHGPAKAAHGSGHGTPETAHATTGGGHGKSAITAEKVTLIAAGRLAELDKARHEKLEEASASIASTTSGIGATWMLMIGIAVLLGVAGAIWKSGMFNKIGVAGKLYAGFATVVLLAVGIGGGGYYFLGVIGDETHLETAAMELDMMSGKVGTLQSEFVLVGIEDKARGEELLKHHDELTAKFAEDLVAIRKMHLTAEQDEAVDHL